MGIHVLGTGSYTPQFQVTNEDMARIVETNDEWIRTRTGIGTRHISDGEPTWYMGAEAAKRAVEAAGIDPAEIGLLIDTTITPEYCTPSMSCIIQGKIGAVNAACFDLNAACSGFVYAMDTAHRFLKTDPSMRYALVIANESLSKITNYSDRSSCILFGDGAAGVVVECREDWPSIGAVLGSHGTDQMLRVPGVETDAPSLIYMEGTKVFKFAIEAVPWCIDQVLQRHGKTIEDVDFFVFHQANARIIDLVVRKYQIPLEKYYKNIQEYGNTSAASIPLVLSDLWDQGKIGAGSRLLIVGFGGGLTWGGAYVEFE